MYVFIFLFSKFLAENTAEDEIHRTGIKDFTPRFRYCLSELRPRLHKETSIGALDILIINICYDGEAPESLPSTQRTSLH